MSKRFKGKDELVAQTKHLRLAGLGPPRRPTPKTESLLQRGDWTLVGLSVRQDDRRGWSLARQKVEKLIETRAKVDILAEHPPFKALEMVVLGQRGDYGWNYLMAAEDQVRQDPAKLCVDAFLCAHRPESICIHNREGPYSYGLSRYFFKFENLPLVVTRHIYDTIVINDFRVPTLVYGSTSRWIVHPGSIVAGSDIEPYLEEAQKLLDGVLDMYSAFKLALRDGQFGSDAERVKSRTKLELYGQAMARTDATSMLSQTATVNDIPKASQNDSKKAKAEKTSLAQAFSDRQVFRSNETRLNNMLTQRLYKDSVFSNLPRTVKFARWQDTPICDSCGWDVEQRKEVVPQGVRQDRESSMKQLLQLTGYSSGSPALGPTLQSVYA